MRPTLIRPTAAPARDAPNDRRARRVPPGPAWLLIHPRTAIIHDNHGCVKKRILLVLYDLPTTGGAELRIIAAVIGARADPARLRRYRFHVGTPRVCFMRQPEESCQRPASRSERGVARWCSDSLYMCRCLRGAPRAPPHVHRRCRRQRRTGPPDPARRFRQGRRDCRIDRPIQGRRFQARIVRPRYVPSHAQERSGAGGDDDGE